MRCNDSFKLTNVESPNILRLCNERFNFMQAFSIPLPSILDVVYHLVKRANFSMKELLDTEYYFVYFLFEKLNEEIKEENKRKEEEARQQEQEYENQKSMYDFSKLPSYNDLQRSNYNDY